MADSHILDLLNLCVRMLHFISGVAWIGASFYFNWLENSLERAGQRQEIAGSLWAVHGGGFYYLEKYKIAPIELPKVLHWFKWEAYTTWMSGFALLILVYYFNAGIFLADPTHTSFPPNALIALGIAVLAVGWGTYDQLCKSRFGQSGLFLTVFAFISITALAFGLTQIMNPRGVYMHVGAMLGTCMAANVFFVIIPSQKLMVKAAEMGQPPDGAMGKKALLRSRHNNYLTLPVLFVMISNHFPFTYTHPYSWLVLPGLGLCGGLIRHWFNLKGKGEITTWPLLTALLLFVSVGWFTKPQGLSANGLSESPTQVPFATAQHIIQKHCIGCHSSHPTDDIFKAAPAGIMYDTPDQMHALAPLIRQRAVVLENMPFGNKTNMTKEERKILGIWIDQGAQLSP